MKYCTHCGIQLQESMLFCPQCGEKITMGEARSTVQKPEDARTDIDSIGRGETTYFSDERGISITDSRIVIYGDTYVMANITSIRREHVPSSRPGKIGAIILGLWLVLMFSIWHLVPGIIVGVIIMVIGIITTITHKDIWRLRIRTAAGDERVLMLDWDLAKQLEDSINEALSKRG